MSSKPPSTEASPITGDLKPTHVGDYADEGEIARGGQGSIRRVVDNSLLRPLAMKLLDPKLAVEEVHRKRFVEEAQITAQLDHPNIPPVHRIGMDADGRIYFTLKLLRGETFGQVLRRGAHHGDAAELHRVLQIFVTICNAVAFAHGRGVVHRDLKPENVMVAEHGQVYVMDWGIARIMGHARPSGQDSLPPVRVWGTETNERGVITGTPEYMAPEQATGRLDDIDERTDVFALGAILYEILVGHPPFVASDPLASVMRAAMVNYVPPQSAARHPVPDALCGVVERAMRHDPRSRYPSVEALRADVEKFMRMPSNLPVYRFDAGSTILREGDPAELAFVILRGRVRVYKTVAGRRVVLRELGAGAAFGEAAIFSSQPRSASVEAIDAVFALAVSRTALERELSETSMLGPLVRQLAARFQEIDHELTAHREGASAIARAAVLYVAAHGVDVAPGKKAVSWSALVGYLAASLGCRADDVEASLRVLPQVELDLATDILRMTTDRYA